ncbi:MAG: response regulator [Planctomycetes bacterium]|nr:response regulator [Planctomycetota bacterium]
MTNDTRPVLLVEDNDDHAAIFADCLSRSGAPHGLVRACSMEHAIKAIPEHDPALVVLDLELPDARELDGLNQLEKACPSLPVVVLTANSRKQLGTDAIRIGAQDYLVKGQLTAEDLERSLRYAVERQRIISELEHRNREVEAFASVASHDLRAPLRKIASVVDILMDDLDDVPPQQRRLLEMLQGDAARLKSLVEDLLKFARAGRAALEPDPVSLGEVVEDACAFLSVELEETQANVAVEPLPTVAVDRNLITLVFQNLIGNAVKYVEGGTPEVSIRAETVGTLHRIWVCDSGIGIAAADQERIFDAGTRAVSYAEFAGSGLGLATCQNVLAAHGGQIGVESTPGSGASFWFTLPAIRLDLNE